MGRMFVKNVIIIAKVVFKILNLHVTHVILICLDKKISGALVFMGFLITVSLYVKVSIY